MAGNVEKQNHIPRRLQLAIRNEEDLNTVVLSKVQFINVANAIKTFYWEKKYLLFSLMRN